MYKKDEVMRDIFQSEPMQRLMNAEATLMATGRLGSYKGKQTTTEVFSLALDTAYKAGEENGVEKSLEIIKRHKFESFQGRDVLMSGNQVLSEVKKVPDLIKMSELLDVVKTIEKVVLSKELK